MHSLHPSRAHTHSASRKYRPAIELLEARIAPAFTLSLSFDATVGVSSSSAGGVTTFTATASGANLSWLDIAIAMAAGADVVVNTGSTGTEAGNILDLVGTNKTISNSSGTSLTFESGTGANLVGDINLGTITLSGANSLLVVDAHQNVLLNGVGSAATPVTNVDLSADTGTISNTAKLFATNLSASAATGIGTLAAPLLTQVTNVVATAGTGGIFITNTGALTVGFTGAPFQGVEVTGATGNIQITNDATISITRGGDGISAPGNVTIVANGATSNILTDGDSSTTPAIESRNQGVVTLTAGQDILLGGAADSNTGDVVSAGGGNAAINLTAGRDIKVRGGTSVALTNGSAGSGITATAGRDLSITGLGDASSVSEIISSGGAANISLTAANLFTANVGPLGTAINSTGGAVTINAGDMSISSEIDAGSGTVTLQQASTVARDINLGLGTGAGTLGLSTLEVGFVTAGELRIGRLDNPGNISVTGLVAPTGTNSLTLLSGGSINDGTGTEQADLVVPNLTLQAVIQIGASAADRLDFDTTTLNASVNTAGGQRIFLRDTAGGVSVASIGTNDANGGSTAVFLTANNGEITSATVDANPDIRGTTITLNVTGAAGKIGAGAANPLEVNASASLSASTGGLVGSDIFLTDTTGGANIGEINAGLGNVTLTALNGSINSVTFEPVPVADVIGNVVSINVTGATSQIGVGNTALQVQAGTLNATSQGGNIALQQATGGVAIGQVNAGTGNVTLLAPGGPITSLSANDGIAEVVGNVVTLTVTAPSNGNTGQIGSFTTSAQFLEVDAGTLNASTNNSRLWIREIGSGPGAGVAIGSINAGTNTAFLQVANGGDITSANLDGTPDIIADTVNLRALNGGSLGLSNANPLEINAANLNAAVQAGLGGINVRDTAGGLNVVLGQTTNGVIDIETVGAAANLTLTSIVAPIGTVTLRASGAVNDAGTASSVTADTVVILAGTGIGVSSALDIDVANLSASVSGTGGINVRDINGSLNVILGQTTDGDISLQTAAAASNLTIAEVHAAGHTVTLTAPGTINGAVVGANAVTANSLVVTAGTGIGTTDPLEIDTASLSAIVQTAGSIRVKDTAGGLSVSLAQTSNGTIDLEAAGDSANLTLTNVSAPGNTVVLRAAGAVDSAAPGTPAVSASNLSIIAGTGIGVAAPLEVNVGDLAAVVQAAGNIRVKDTAGGLNVTSAETFDGDIELEAAGANADLTLADVTALNRTVTLGASGVVNGAIIGTPAVIANTVAITTGIGIGTTDILELDVANLSANVTLAGDISIRDVSGGLHVLLAQTLGGDINLEAAGNLMLSAVNALGNTVTLATPGTINGATTDANAVTADDLTITAGAGIGTVNPLEIDVATLAATVQSNGDLRVKDTAGGLSVLLAQTSNGDIHLETAGASTDLALTNVIAPLRTVFLKATGAVNDAFLDGSAAVSAANLAITAGTGIGTSNVFESAVTSLAFNNGAGSISIVNDGALTIASVGELTSSTNTGSTTSLTATGPLTFAANTTSAGNLIASVTEGAALSGGLDNIIVNGGVSLTSQADLSLLAGDDISINADALLFATGTVLISVDFGNNDGGIGGVATLQGGFGSATVSIRGDNDADTFVIRADGAVENIDGSGGFDTYRVLGIAGDVVFTDSGVTSVALGNDTFTSIERVDLAGDANINVFDATGFTGLAVLSGNGGKDILLGADVLIQPQSVILADVDGDSIEAKLNKGVLDFANLRFEANPNGIRLQSIDLLGNAAFDGVSLTITAKVGPGGDGFANIGQINATGLNLGRVKIAGDVGQILAGTGDAKKAAISSLTVRSLGALDLVSGAESLQSNIIGKLGTLIVKGDINGATLNVTGDIGSVQVHGDVLGGAADFSGTILAAGDIGRILIKGSLEGGSGDYSGSIVTSSNASIGSVTIGSILGGASAFNGIFSDGKLGKVKVTGSITGSETFPATISAKGDMLADRTAEMLAIKGLNVGGSVRFASILAGYSTNGAGVNADVRIGGVSVGSNWIASNIAAGVVANGEGGFGTPDDARIPGGSGDMISKIASIAIKGTAFGTPTAGGHFGFVAEEIGKFSIGKSVFPIERGASNDTAGFSLGSFGDLVVREI
jgi:hypothetical protein